MGWCRYSALFASRTPLHPCKCYTVGKILGKEKAFFSEFSKEELYNTVMTAHHHNKLDRNPIWLQTSLNYFVIPKKEIKQPTGFALAIPVGLSKLTFSFELRRLLHTLFCYRIAITIRNRARYPRLIVSEEILEII